MEGQSNPLFVPSVMKTEAPLDCDNLARKDLLLQQHGERIEKLSQQDKLSKFCTDAGFLNVVENGQYFVTKDIADFSQFHAVACRESTLPREEGASQPKDGSKGTPRLGPYWKLRPVTCMVNMDLRSEFGPRTETILTPGLEFFMDQTTLW